MRFTFIQQHRGDGPLAALCRVLGVTQPGYRAWQKRQTQPGPRQQADAGLLLHIQAAHRQGRHTGCPLGGAVPVCIRHYKARASGSVVSEWPA